MTVAPIAGALADRIGERPLMVGGLSLQAVGMAWVALIAEPGVAYSSCSRRSSSPASASRWRSRPRRTRSSASVAKDAIGKAAGTNSMMRELGGVFGIAVVVAVFAGAGSYASAAAFTDGFGPAILVGAGLALAGAVAGLALPGRRQRSVVSISPRAQEVTR